MVSFGGPLRASIRSGFLMPLPVNEEWWSEYLVALGDSPVNFHQYLVPGLAIEPNDVVVDCGTCEGFFTRAALEAGAKKVICVEPSKVMAQCFRLTFAPEIAVGRVVIEECALGDYPGMADFSDTDIFGGHIDSGEGTPVRVSTLDQMQTSHGPLTFLKMDLEDVEYQALLGGRELLSEAHPRLAITTYHNPWDYVAVQALISSLGYRNHSPKRVTLRGTATPRPVMIHVSKG